MRMSDLQRHSLPVSEKIHCFYLKLDKFNRGLEKD